MSNTKPSGKYTYTISSGASIRLPIAGSYFKILAASGAVNVRGDFGLVSSISANQGLESTQFAWLEITDASGAQNTFTIYIGDARYIDTGLQVTKNVPTLSSNTNGYATYTPGVASQVIRSGVTAPTYLCVQNNDPAVNIYVRFASVPAVGTGLKIPPGGTWELTAGIPTFTLYMIADGAGTAGSVLVIAMT